MTSLVPMGEKVAMPTDNFQPTRRTSVRCRFRPADIPIGPACRAFSPRRAARQAGTSGSRAGKRRCRRQPQGAFRKGLLSEDRVADVLAGVTERRVDPVLDQRDRLGLPEAGDLGLILARVELQDLDALRSTLTGNEPLTPRERGLRVSNVMLNDDIHRATPFRPSFAHDVRRACRGRASLRFTNL